VTGRRDFIRALGLGAGGVTLLGPLLSRFAGAADEVPCRFVFIVEGNGYEPVTVLSDPARSALDATMSSPIDTKRWWYRSYQHDSPLVVDGGLETARSLSPLAADPAVAEQACVLLGLSSRIIGGGHSAHHGVLSSARTISGVPGGQTFDAFLGGLAQVRGETPFDVLRLGVRPGSGDPLDFGTCAFGPGRAAPLMLRPDGAYNALFGLVGSDAGRAAFSSRRSLLDFARRDVNRAIAEFPGNSRERQKLETYLASVEELTRRHERMVELGPELEANAPVLPGDNPLLMSDDPLEHYRAQLQLITAAFKGSLTNVAVLGSGTGGAFGLTYSSVSSVGRHDMHHGSGGNAELRAAIHEVTRLQVEAIVTYLASELAATPEGDGSMLDHTVIVFVGDNGEQHHSTASEFPVVLIGGRALGLSTGGRTIAYPGMSSDGHRQVSNVWNTIGHIAGEDLNEFGQEGPSRRAAGPLSELIG